MYLTWIAFVLSCATLTGTVARGQAAETADLTIVVQNLRSGAGQIHLAVWKGPDGFTDPEAAMLKTDRPAEPGQVRFDLGGLAPGRYAVATYHDENGNGEFDRTWLGWPDEGLGFSNGAWIRLGRPSFEDAAFEVRPEPRAPQPQVIVIALRYASEAEPEPNRSEH